MTDRDPTRIPDTIPIQTIPIPYLPVTVTPLREIANSIEVDEFGLEEPNAKALGPRPAADSTLALIGEKSVVPVVIDEEVIEKIDELVDYEKKRKLEGKGFRLNHSDMMLTYPTHLDKVMLKAFLQGLSKTKIKVFECAHEAPEKPRLNKDGTPAPSQTPYEHTHVVLRFEKKLDITNPRFFDYKAAVTATNKEGHPNIKVLYGRDCFMNCMRYLAKEDPANSHLADYGKSLANRLWEEETIQDALQHATRYGDVMGIEALYRHKPETSGEVEIIELGGRRYHANAFQNHVINFIHKCDEIEESGGKIDDRNINWYYDDDGDLGKSKLGKDLIRSKKAWYIKNNAGGSATLATLIQNAVKNGWDSKYIVFDFCRTVGEYDNSGIYTILENIKDEILTVSRYNSTTLDLKRSPIIFVFANWMPDIFSKNGKPTLSLDRWNIMVCRERDVDVLATERLMMKIKNAAYEYKARTKNRIEDWCPFKGHASMKS